MAWQTVVADSLDSGLARAPSAEFIKDRAVGAVVAFAGGDQAAQHLNDAPMCLHDDRPGREPCGSVASYRALLQSVSVVADSLDLRLGSRRVPRGTRAVPSWRALRLRPEQIKVPYLFWMSEAIGSVTLSMTSAFKAQRHGFLTHDTVYHTVLVALGLRNAFYRHDLDLIGPAGQSIRFSSADGLILLKYIKRVTRYLFGWHQSFTSAWNSHRWRRGSVHIARRSP